MNIIGFSGLSNSHSFKQKRFPGLSSREYNIAQGFDAAAALLGHEGVLAAAAEERFTRQKATGAFPINAIRYCLKAANLNVSDVHYFAHGFSYEPHKSAFQSDDFVRRQYEEVFAPDVQKRFLSEHLGDLDWDKKFVPVPHHLAHAASAFYLSGFEDALILISDGMGEVQSLTVATGQGRDIKILTEISAFHSLGTLYGVFTHYLGFYINSDEYKVMGLAPYGNSRRFFNQMMEFVSLRNDGTYTLPIFAHNHTREEQETHAGVLRFLADQFGPPRDPEAEITQHHKDIAASLQSVLQTCQLHVLRHFRRQTGQKNLCLAGGVALNCSCNGLIKRSDLFDRVFVQPAAGDDGTALGAALYVQRLHHPDFKPSRITVPLWGPEFNADEIRQALESRGDCQIVEMDSFDELCKDVAGRLANGQIIAWFQGRLEFGPRALGSRSILADPRDPTMRDRINALVKKREAFRPFAPVVAAEAAAKIFEINPGEEDTYSHMLYVTHVRSEYRDKLPATTHVDGSARIQTVSKEQNPRLWQLLKDFAQHTDLPVLLNTSFNVRGQPIVCTPQEAVETFLTAKLDVLVVGNFIVVPKLTKELERKDGEERLEELQQISARHEEFWVNRLCSLQPVGLPFKRQEAQSAPSSSRNSADSSTVKLVEAKRDSLPPEVVAVLNRNRGDGTPAEALLAAFAAFLGRLTGTLEFDLNFNEADLKREINGFGNSFAAWLPLHIEPNLSGGLSSSLTSMHADLQKIRAHKTYSLDLPTRHPAFRSNEQAIKNLHLPVAVQISDTECSPAAEENCPAGTELMLSVSADGAECVWFHDRDVFEAATVCAVAAQFVTFLRNIVAESKRPLSSVSVLSDVERRKLLVEWNQTAARIPDASIHQLFDAQAGKTPDAIALVFEDQQITYGELRRRADLLASELGGLGVGPDVLVGICVERSIEMMIGLLGILKAGGAYVPLDPAYPKERLAFMLEDSKPLVLVTQTALLDLLPETSAHIVFLDKFDWSAPSHQSEPDDPSPTSNQRSPISYVIYTSGSTGKPKGAMITHRNVVNFFVGMDQRLKPEAPGVWLAVTSISFDISVLEIFWTLTRGFKVVIQRNEAQRTPTKAASREGFAGAIDFSLFYFASDESSSDSQKYRLLLEGAKFADQNGFAAVWTPERHFHAFGGLYPNPSVTSAAVAAVTRRVQIRAGSVVLPLHNPIRVAEEWAVVDNLSNGRVAISFASGWQVNDFVLAPGNYVRRKEIMLEQIELVRKLWRGETVSFRNSKGQDVPLRILPRPIQPELPIWITASGHPDTFKLAGELGANVLTHLLGQSVSELAEKLAIYRSAWKERGHPGTGQVTLMLHTFVGEDDDAVREIVREPFTAYLRSSIDLIKNDPWAFGTFKRPANDSNGSSKAAHFTDEELDAMSKHAFGRYFETSGLFGSHERCREMIERLRTLGVDEIGCLIDFGVPAETVLSSLQQLNAVRKSSILSVNAPAQDYSIPAQLLRHRVTHFQCTPSLAAMLIEDSRALGALRSLKKLLLGGEALPASLVQRLDMSGDILNMYGPTETTIWSTSDTVAHDELVTIGRPIANTQIYIVDRFMQPVPIGVPGELLIGGAGVVRGYFNRPDLTAEKFIPNPFITGDEKNGDSRLYRTGDLARYLPEGRIEFLGRLDHQVKLRGFRIELGEVEAALRQHPEIKDCVAIVREDIPGDKRLVAYPVLHPGKQLQTRSLREHLKSKLPDYMIPAAFVPLESLPLTPNGKIDRKALPIPRVNGQPTESTEPPNSPLEQTIAEISGELLGVTQISIHDNFFELGGNSLLATQLIARLRETLSAELPLRLAFEFPTVESLARAISADHGSGKETTLPDYESIARRENPAAAPLSFAQQRLWFLHQLEPGSHYNDHFDLRLHGELNVQILERAINEIVRRHEILRSRFVEVEGEPVQSIASAIVISLPVIDLSHLPNAEREREAIRLAVDDCRQPFALEHAPLFRSSLVRIAAEDHLLILTFDHIVVDGWSHGVFLSELTQIYDAFLAGRPSPLSGLPIQYTDFAVWQQRWMQGEAMARHLEYWKRQLNGAPQLLELPTDRPRPRIQTFRGTRIPLTLDKEIIERLGALGRKEGCTLFMVLLAGFQTLLSRISGSADIVIGSPIANRNRPEVEPLIGSFINTLALRGDFSGNPTFLELLKRVRQTALDAYAHQDLPFEKLVAEVQPTRNLAHSPIFQVMFILQNTPMPPMQAGSLSIAHQDIDAGSSKLDLTLNLEESGGGCIGWIEYSTDLFERTTINRLIAHFQTLLKSIAASPGTGISRLAMESEVLKSSVQNNPVKVGRGSSKRKLSGQDLPRSPIQKELTAIWSEVLGVQHIAPDDNLFDLGGHSLLITRIISRIRKAFQVDVPIHAFFETPSVAAIATLIESERKTPIAPRSVNVEVIRKRTSALLPT